MNWFTGKSTSVPEDARAFLECDRSGHWAVYKTDEDGYLLDGFPRLRDDGFASLAEAQAWVEENVPARAVASGAGCL